MSLARYMHCLGGSCYLIMDFLSMCGVSDGLYRQSSKCTRLSSLFVFYFKTFGSLFLINLVID